MPLDDSPRAPDRGIGNGPGLGDALVELRPCVGPIRDTRIAA